MPALKSNDLFVATITNNLTDIKHKVLNFLYAPIVGVNSIQVYMALYSCVGIGTFESNAMPHQTLLQTMSLKPQDFILLRENLEAMGLLDVYYNQGVYLYLLKEPLHPYDFFKNEQLAHLLSIRLGKKEFEKLVIELSTYKFDITKFTNITKSFDEVYGIVPLKKENIYSNLWASAHNNGVVLKDKHFEFDYLHLILRSRDILSDKVLNSEKFYHEVNTLSFFYGFCEKDLEEIVCLSVDSDKNINYDELRKHAKIRYDKRQKPVTIERITPPTMKSQNEVVNTLNSLSPNEHFKAKYGVDLMGSEIEIIREVSEKTGFPNGVINVLVTYVVDELNGAFPNANYFLRVANGWKRAKIATTEDALNHINKNNARKRTQNKTEANTPSWYKKYLTDLDQKVKASNEKYQGMTLEDVLKDFKEKE